MRNHLAPALAVTCALAVAGPAGATLSPQLSASTTDSFTTLSFKLGSGDSDPAVVTYYVPADVNLNTSVVEEGVPVGKVTATGTAADTGGSTVHLTGQLTTALTTTGLTYGGTATTVGALRAACFGPAAPTGQWLLTLNGGGATLQAPVYVNQLYAGDPLADREIAEFTLTLCLPPASVPAGTSGRAPSGLKLTDWTIVSQESIQPFAPGWYVWRAVATGYAQGTANREPTSVEAQSVARYPAQVTLTAKAAVGKQARVAGRVAEGGKGVAKAKVDVLAGTKKLGSLTTDSRGFYRGVVTLPGARATLTAVATVAPRPNGTCQLAFTTSSCVGSTIGGFVATSDRAVVKA
jgi:hypothetical protein